MKTCVFGSLNVDKTYTLSSFVRPGQTVSALGMEEFCGGKGFNQAVALRRAGCEVYFAGAVGQDGQMLLSALDRHGIDRCYVKTSPGATGHAVIQVDEQGQNCIIILAGANGTITEEDVENVLSFFEAGDLIVLQNEITCVPQIIRLAHEKGMVVAANPSPYNEKIALWDLNGVDILLVNEEEGAAMAGVQAPEAILHALQGTFPGMTVVLTLGGEGATFQSPGGERISVPARRMPVVDTTAAGDTFTGFFLAEYCRSGDAAKAMRTAAAAAGIAVSRKGAEPSIPRLDEVESIL